MKARWYVEVVDEVSKFTARGPETLTGVRIALHGSAMVLPSENPNWVGFAETFDPIRGNGQWPADVMNARIIRADVPGDTREPFVVITWTLHGRPDEQTLDLPI